MNRMYFERKLAKLLPSEKLKEQIKLTKHKFSDNDLIAIIDAYSPTLDCKLQLFKQAKSVFYDKQLIKTVDKLIKYYNDVLTKFTTQDDNAVFEVIIRTSPDSIDESYLSKTYDEALLLIKYYLRYYKNYGAKDNKQSAYVIKKRLIFYPQQPSDVQKTSQIGKCVLGFKQKILDIEYDDEYYEHYEDCEKKNCKRCKKPCVPKVINLPRFLKKYDFVALETTPYLSDFINYAIKTGNVKTYTVNGKPNYVCGIITDDITDYTIDDCAYVVLMDSKYIKERIMLKKDNDGYYPVFMDHDHIPYPKLQVLSQTEIPKELREDYFYAIEQFKILENLN